MLEPRFNSDTLAMLLNIPPQKTLLRRHLTTNFNSLVGTQAQLEKREYTDAAGYSPISITAKVKVVYQGGRERRERRSRESASRELPNPRWNPVASARFNLSPFEACESRMEPLQFPLAAF